MEAARTGRSNFTTASGSRASSGSFPLARTISRVGAHCVLRAREWSVHPPRTRENLHRFLGPLCGKFSRQFSSGTRHSSSPGAQGSGRHWTRARHGRWTTWTGSRILPRNPMSPRISAICTRTSEVRFARETAAVLGQRPASACAFRERRVRLAKRRKGNARSRRDAAARRASTFAESRRDRHRLSSRSREPLTRAPNRSLPASPSPEKSPSDRPQCRATRLKMTSRRRTARWRKSRTPISTPLPCSERQPLGLSTR
jgi:hypothetical protein